MKLYRLLTGDESTEFCHKVSEALSNGWDLYGDPTYAHDETVGVMRCGEEVVKEVSGSYPPDFKLGAQ